MRATLEIRRLWWVPWALFFVLCVLGVKRAAEWASADEPVVSEGFDPTTWKPCPGRKPERFRGRKAVWYCGPEQEAVVAQSPTPAAPAAPAKTPKSKHSKSKDPVVAAAATGRAAAFK